MANYHAGILGIFLAGSFLYTLWVMVFLKQRRKLDYKRFQQAADNQSSIVQLINGMQEIKLNNCEKQKRWEWERIQAKLYKISIQSMTLEQTQQVGGLFIDQTKNVLVSFLAAKAVVDGNMTLDMMIAVRTAESAVAFRHDHRARPLSVGPDRPRHLKRFGITV